MMLCGNKLKFYSYSDGKYHYKSELPKTLQPFVTYVFSSGDYTGDDFKQFIRKYRNAIIKMLPEGYKLYSWHPNHYAASGVIQDDKGRFIYMSISDVRYFHDEWIDDILIRTMAHDQDWHGGSNNRTDLINFAKDIAELYKEA